MQDNLDEYKYEDSNQQIPNFVHEDNQINSFCCRNSEMNVDTSLAN